MNSAKKTHFLNGIAGFNAFEGFTLGELSN
jgi:hypothetical protein